MIKKIIFLLFITSTIQCGPLLEDGSMNVSFYQFNETELGWVKSNQIMKGFTEYFDKNVKTTFEEEYCLKLQKLNKEKDSSMDIKTIFGTLFTGLNSGRCTAEECALSKNWNETNQNKMSSESFYQYTSEILLLLFPVLIVVTMLGFYFGVLNCIYLNFCYFACFAQDPTKKQKSYYRMMLIMTGISSFFYIAVGALLESQISMLKTYGQDTVCQIISNNVYQVITGINLTDPYNGGVANKKINWQGLNYLDEAFDTYYAELIRLRLSLLKSNDTYFVNTTDTLNDSYKFLQLGFDQFKNFSENSDLSVIDPNGETNPDFKITYACSSCKNSSRLIASYSEVNQTLFSLQNILRDYRNLIYSQIIDENNWSSLIDSHEKSRMMIKINLYKSYKFYNIVKENTDLYEDTFNVVVTTELLFYVINFLIGIFGVFGYKCIKTSIAELNSKQEIMNYKGAAERDSGKVKGRWTFHSMINVKMFTTIFNAAVAVGLVLLAVFVFEGSYVMENKFFNQHKMKNFTFVPHGDFIDTCSDKMTKNLNDFLGFTNYHNYYKKMTNNMESVKNKYSTLISTPITDEFADFANKLDPSSFHSVSDPNLKWDLNGEQVDYFLFPLSEYKYIKNPPIETLREYTDFSFNPPAGFTDKQYSLCSNYTSFDVWTRNEQSCYKVSFDIQIKTDVNAEKDRSLNCYTLSMKPINKCTETNSASCFVNYFMTRYSLPTDFSNCKINKSYLNSESVSNTRDYFLKKINSLLTSAMNEKFLENTMKEKSSIYRVNHNSMILDRINDYKTKLKDAYNYFIGLTQRIDEMRIWLVRDENVVDDPNKGVVNRAGMMRNTDCSFLTDNFKVFLFSRNLLAESYFGISLLLITLSLILLINASLHLIIHFRLKTDKELSDIRKDIETHKAIEEAEKKYFFATNNFIESEDAQMMGLDDHSSKNHVVPVQNLTADKSHDINSPQVKNKSETPQKEGKKYSIINKFLMKQEKEYDSRNKN